MCVVVPFSSLSSHFIPPFISFGFFVVRVQGNKSEILRNLSFSTTFYEVGVFLLELPYILTLFFFIKVTFAAYRGSNDNAFFLFFFFFFFLAYYCLEVEEDAPFLMLMAVRFFRELCFVS